MSTRPHLWLPLAFVTALASLLALGCRAETSSPVGAVSTEVEADITAGSASTATAPSCDDVEVQLTLLDLFDAQTLIGNRSDDVLLSVGKIQEIGSVVHPSGNWGETRRCSATGTASRGEEIGVWYDIVMPRGDDDISYRVKPCFSRQGDPKEACAGYQDAPQP